MIEIIHYNTYSYKMMIIMMSTMTNKFPLSWHEVLELQGHVRDTKKSPQKSLQHGVNIKMSTTEHCIQLTI